MSPPKSESTVLIDGQAVRMAVVELDGGMRLRAEAGEWETLGVSEGERIEVVLPNDSKRAYFVAGASRVEPWYWVELLTSPSITSMSSPLRVGGRLRAAEELVSSKG